MKIANDQDCMKCLYNISADEKNKLYNTTSKLIKSEKRRWGAIRGVREVVKAASNKMSAAPELNPGD